MFVDDERDKLAESDGTFAKYLGKILDYYFSFHHDAYNMKGMCLETTELLKRSLHFLYV